jgi:hypothetical protein
MLFIMSSRRRIRVAAAAIVALLLLAAIALAACSPVSATGPSDLPSWVKPGVQVELYGRAFYGPSYDDSTPFGPGVGDIATVTRGGLFGRGSFAEKFDGLMGYDKDGRPIYHERHGEWTIRVAVAKQTKIFGRTVKTSEVGWIFLANVRPVPTAVPTPAQPKP